MARKNPAPRFYLVWCAMRNRCNNPKNHAYHRYGGRGIKVCEQWSVYKTFAEDIGLPPDDGQRWTIDRIDVNGDYCPENFRWATYKEQNSNRRDNVFVQLIASGAICTIEEGARRLGVPSETFRRKIHLGTMQGAMKCT